MIIKSLNVRNYKSVLDSGEVSLSSGFNIFCGQNNAGKSSLIETLSVEGWRDQPHRSMLTKEDAVNPESSVALSLIVTGAEIFRGLVRSGQPLCVPVLAAHAHDHKKCHDLFAASSNIALSATRFTQGWRITGISVDNLSAIDQSFQLTRDSDNNISLQYKIQGFSALNSAVDSIFRESCYFFKAERLAISSQPQKAETILQPKAGNLADVLHSFQNTARSRYENFLADIRTVLPSINIIITDTFMAHVVLPGQVTTTHYPHVKVKVWLAGASEDRKDLAFDLEDCGTGVGQIVSMLLVIHSATSPKVIVIDEPNSFLHPGATRRLYQVFRRFSQHQFIVSTHSAELLSCAERPSVHLIRWENGSSKIKSLSVENTDQIKSVLEDLGIRLSDVFGADKIIWVEGPTEVKVFSDILLHKGVDFQAGLRFLPVVSTSDIAKNTKKAKTIVDIYETISKANAIIPPSVIIGLDRESFTDDQLEALTARLGNKVRFLDRRCIENYALSIAAISEVLSSLEERRIEEVQTAVEKWLEQNASNEIYKSPRTWDGDLSNKNWLTKVDGAKLLADIFDYSTEGRHAFNKIKHTPLLIAYRLKQEENEIKNLIDYVMGLYEPALSRPSSTPQ